MYRLAQCMQDAEVHAGQKCSNALHIAWTPSLKVLGTPPADSRTGPKAAADDLSALQTSHGNIQVGSWHSSMVQAQDCQE